MVVVIKRGRCPFGLVLGPIHGVDKEDVLPTVIVIVDDADTAAHGLGKVLFAEGSAVVAKVYAGGGGDIGETDGARGPHGGRLDRGRTVVFGSVIMKKMKSWYSGPVIGEISDCQGLPVIQERRSAKAKNETT